MPTTKTAFWRSVGPPFIAGFRQGFDRMLAPARLLRRMFWIKG